MGTGNGELRAPRKLLGLRARLVGDMNQMADAARNKDRVQTVRMPTDMAEVGTEAFEQELTLNLLGNEKGVLEQIEAALKRIEDGSFGRCEECGAGFPSLAWTPSPMRPCASSVPHDRKSRTLEGHLPAAARHCIVALSPHGRKQGSADYCPNISAKNAFIASQDRRSALSSRRPFGHA